MAIPASINRNTSRADIGVLFGPADLATLHGAGTIGANHGEGTATPTVKSSATSWTSTTRGSGWCWAAMPSRAAEMIERRSAEDRKWVFLSERTNLQEVAKQ
jgi:hypothetical protein